MSDQAMTARRPSDPQVALCQTCQQSRPLKEFLPSRHTPDGRLAKCLTCIRVRAENDRVAREARMQKVAR